MRAAILLEAGGLPRVGEFADPDGEHEVVDVRLAGLNPVDLILASGQMGAPTTPAVVGQEGIGITESGARVYFTSPPDPYGSWADRTAIDPNLTFPVPDGVDDELAVALGIAGQAAWLPLTRHVDVSGRQSVLILGATGTAGRIAIQAAKLLGAGRVVGAGRDPEALEEAAWLGLDATVLLGGHDDVAALAAEAGDGYEVVLDFVYGDPFLAALECSANQSTLVSIGAGAGELAAAPFRSLQGRTHVGHANYLMPADVQRAAYEELAAHAAEGRIFVETRTYGLDKAEEAWKAQQEGTHVKLAVAP